MLNRFSAPRRCQVVWLVALVTCQPAVARTLLVGPTRELARPSAAAAVARDGDTILIDPGSYTDCAVWTASRLTIAPNLGALNPGAVNHGAANPGALNPGTGNPGTGNPTGAHATAARISTEVVLRDRVCQNKGIFVTVGDNITIRGITFTGARAPAYNGAGIRAQGANLTLIDSRFLDNENGILAAAMPTSTIRVLDSEFRGNGACVQECAHGIYVGRIAVLDIERSHFADQHIGHHIKSRALRTVLIDDTIVDGPDGTSSYLVDLPNGGDLLMRGCALEKGPNSDNPVVAVTIGEEALTNPTRRIELLGNQFRNDLAQQTIFLRNVTNVPAELAGNRVSGPVVTVEGPATIRP